MFKKMYEDLLLVFDCRLDIKIYVKYNKYLFQLLIFKRFSFGIDNWNIAIAFSEIHFGKIMHF